MKTKILIIASLICGGMIFTSCQKDNSLIEETSFDQMTLNQETPDSPKASTFGDLHDPGPIGIDMITNFPDPFKLGTTISYIVPEKYTRVRLSVHKNSSEFVVLLVNEFKSPGQYQVKFDASGLPAGKYTAILNIGGVVYKEEMTKSPLWQEKDGSPVSEL